MPTMTAHPFDTDTQVEPAGEHAYAATLSDRWTALGGVPNGGYLLAVTLRALRRELTFPDPLVASATFLRPARVGAAQLRTDVARSGRRVATGEARLTQDGREIVRTVATFGDLARAGGRTLVRSRPPDLPAPEACVELAGDGALPGVTIVDRFEYRAREVPGWTRGRPTGEPDVAFWMRFRGGRDADPLALAALVDAAAPAVLELGVAGSATMELTVHVRGRPAPGWLACRATTRYVIDGYHEEDFEIWDSTGRLVAQSRQFAVLAG
jgi:acyl-CoA thioesterase